MNESSLHLKLVKLYLLYFESVLRFEQNTSHNQYNNMQRILREIEKITKQRKVELKEFYHQTDYYKNVRKPKSDERIKEFLSRFKEQENLKK